MKPPKKSIWQAAWDFIGIPARLVLFPPEWLERCGWTTLEAEREKFMAAALGKHVSEKLIERVNDVTQQAIDLAKSSLKL